jgi:hypothetical protein
MDTILDFSKLKSTSGQSGPEPVTRSNTLPPQLYCVNSGLQRWSVASHNKMAAFIGRAPSYESRSPRTGPRRRRLPP